MKVSLALLLCTTCFSIFTANFASGEQFYIVTSPDSPCPTREQGEPCLTLEQYTTNPMQPGTSSDFSVGTWKSRYKKSNW